VRDRPSDASDDAATAGSVTPEAADRYAAGAAPAGMPSGPDSEVGRGGMGRVLVVFDSHLGREIALKELLGPASLGARGDEAASQAAARFLREARITGQLAHPGVVPVYELGQRDDGKLYYTMKLVRGRTFSRALRQADGPSERLALLGHFVDLCQAVAYAHSRGVVHRDIKPDNVMVGEFGETVLLDWGLAKMRGLDDVQEDELAHDLALVRSAGVDDTVLGSAVGTPAYMSPEQAEGRIADIDERSDVWGLGAVLYEVLTGSPPFPGKTAAEIIYKVTQAPVRPVRRKAPQAPPELAAVAEKALRREPNERYPTAAGLASEVEAWLSGGRVVAYDYGSLELLRRFVGRNRWLSLSVLLALCTLLVGSALIYGAWGRESRARQQAQRARRVAESAREQEAAARRNAERQEHEARRNLAAAYLARAEALLLERDRLGARVLAAEALRHLPAAREGDEVAGQLAVLQSVLYETEMRGGARYVGSLEGHTEPLWWIAYSKDSTRLASAGRDRTVRVWSVPDGKELLVLRGHEADVNAVEFSYDGSFVASASEGGDVRLWDARTGELLDTLDYPGGPAWTVRMSRDDRYVVFGGESGRVVVWDRRKRRVAASWIAHEGTLGDLEISPDGRRLVTIGEDSLVKLWRFPKGRLEAVLRGHTGWGVSIEFSPDGRRILSANGDGTVRQWSVRGRRALSTLSGHSAAANAAAYSRDGRRIVTCGVDGRVRLWSTAGSLLASLPGPSKDTPDCRIAPDGRFVAAAMGNEVRLWLVEGVDRARPLFKHGWQVANMGCQMNGGRVASAALDGAVHVHDVAKGRAVASFPPHARDNKGLALSPDGRWLAWGADDGSVGLRPADDGGRSRLLGKHDGRATTVAFSPDSSTVISGGEDGGLRLWRVGDGEAAGAPRHHGGKLHAAAWAPDGQRLASAGEGGIRVWRVGAAEPERQIVVADAVLTSVAWAADGASLVSGGTDRTVRIHDAATGAQRRALVGHADEVTVVDWAASRDLILSGSSDHTVRLWDSGSGRPLQTLKLGSPVTSACFLSGGDGVAVNDGEDVQHQPVRLDLWKGDPTKLLRSAERNAGMRLEGQELRPESRPPDPNDGGPRGL